MMMALLALQDAHEGADLTFQAAAAGGDTVPAGHRAGGWQMSVVLVVKNDDAAAHGVTVGSLAEVTVQPSGTAVIPVMAGVYDVELAVTYDAVTSVTVAAAQLTDPQG